MDGTGGLMMTNAAGTRLGNGIHFFVLFGFLTSFFAP